MALKWTELYDATTFTKTNQVGVSLGSLSTRNLISIFDKSNVSSTYENVSIIGSEDKPEIGENIYSEIFLRTREGSEANELINELYRGSYYIINGNVESLFTSSTTDGEKIKVDKSKMSTFLTGFFTRIKEISKDFSEQRQNKLDKLKQEIYNTTNDDFIKLSIYRTLASINTKWLGGTNCKDNSPFKQCTCKTGSDNTYDKIVAENEKIS